MKPMVLAQVSLDLLSQIQASEMEKILREYGMDDPALLKSMKDPNAAVRYQKVVDALTTVTTKK
jgi:hypothetical protein